MEHRQCLWHIVGRFQVEGSVPPDFLGIAFRGRSSIGFDIGVGDGQEGEFLVVTQPPEDGIGGNIHDPQRRCGGMPVIEKFVAVGEIKEPRADSVEASLGASSQEISTDARCGLCSCFPGGSVRHGVLLIVSIGGRRRQRCSFSAAIRWVRVLFVLAHILG